MSGDMNFGYRRTIRSKDRLPQHHGYKDWSHQPTLPARHAYVGPDSAAKLPQHHGYCDNSHQPAESRSERKD